MPGEYARTGFPETARHADRRREPRRVLEVEIVAVQEILRQPRQIEPQRPAVTEIDDRRRHHARHEEAQRNGIRFGARAGAVGRQYRELGLADAGMVARVVAEVPDPGDDPGEADETDDHEGAAPRDHRYQSNDDGRSSGVTKARKGMSDPLGKATPPGPRPVRHRTRRRRKGRSLAETKQEPQRDERPEALDETRQEGRRRPDRAADPEGQARPEAVADPTPDDLKHRIGIAERGKNLAVVRRRELELIAEYAGRRQDV